MRLRDHIVTADRNKVSVGHFNISNLEALRGIFNAARSLDVPVIIGTSEGERKFIGARQASSLVRSLREEHNFPIFLNADHCYSFDSAKEAIDSDYDAVIIDGAGLPIEENIEMTRRVVEYARGSNREVLVEAEIGFIGNSSKMLDELPANVALQEFLTKPEDAQNFVDQTGVDLLAPAVGNLHGMLKSGTNPKLDIGRIKMIRQSAGIPLVLHGGSGISDEDFVRAIRVGISIVHINTEIRAAYRKALTLSLEEKPDEIAPYKLLEPAVQAVEDVVTERLKLFNGKSDR